MIITLDGPSGTGKTTIARKVAERIGFIYFDTGAMYRALTWLALEKNTDIFNPEEVQLLLAAFDFQIREERGIKRYCIGQTDITEAIRSRPITSHVSHIAAQKDIRSALLPLQRVFAAEKNIIFEGRDLGTVVFPQADVKIYLDADPEVRAERRLQEIIDKNPQEANQLNSHQMLEEIRQRDDYDSTREVAPLRCPEDAHLIDTSHMDVDQVVAAVVAHIYKKHPELAPL